MKGNDVLQGFADSAARCPARTAIEIGERRVSYRDLDRWSSELARVLAGGPARPVVAVAAGDPAERVAAGNPIERVAASDSIERVAALLGIWKAGGVYAPLDPAQPPARLAALLDRIAPDWIAGDAGAPLTRSGSTARRCHLDAGRLSVVVEGGPPGAGEPAGPPGPDDLAYLAPTSGSTGAPKLVAGRYRGLGHFVRWEASYLGISEESGVRASQLTSPFFDAYLRDLFVPLATGGTLVVPETPEVRLDTHSLAAWIEAREVELVHCVPSLFHLLSAGDLHPRAFPRLRWVLLAGEPPIHADLARWFGAIGERVRIVNLYGPTETTMTKLFHEVRPADLRRRAVPAGRPMPGAAALLADAAGRPCPPGAVGEVLLRTPYRSLGYFRDPAATAERFVPNPWSGEPGDVVYRTGDLGRLLPDGSLDLLGRRDQQVKVRGQRIELPEVEGALAALPEVAEAAAVARPDADGLAALWAFVVLREGVATAPGALRDALRRALPPAMVPDRVVPVAALPRTANGKLDRRALLALAGAASGRGAEPRGGLKIGPRTPTEERLAALWEEVIEVRESGVRDDFFAAGGHSLMATRLLLRVRAAFGVSMPLGDFLDRPTIEALAERVEDELLARALAGASEDELAALVSELDAELAPAEGAEGG